MGGLFGLDNPIMRFLNKATDCIILNIIWFLCCIPIVTIGASTTAFYYAVTKVIRNDRGYAMREFFHSFKENFKQSTVAWLVMMAVGIVTYVDIYYTFVLVKADVLPKLFFFFLIGIFVIIFMWMIYWLPYIARFEDTLKRMWKLSFIMSVQNFLWSILNFIVFALMAVLVLMIPLLIVFVPVICTVILGIGLERVFRKYMSEKDLYLEDLRNGNITDEFLESDGGM